ncbi:hypothetical protein J6590_098441 [Homalodisca vitripennis]|nr:hypothetical protein J6590_098441 [Homalodisca vitripennis]
MQHVTNCTVRQLCELGFFTFKLNRNLTNPDRTNCHLVVTAGLTWVVMLLAKLHRFPLGFGEVHNGVNSSVDEKSS